jgi:hypothetical protein
METCYGLKTLLKAHQLPHFFIDSRIDMVGFMNPHKVIARRNAFSAFPSVWNGVGGQGRKWRIEMWIFTSGKDLDLQEIPKLIPFQTSEHQKKNNEDENVGKKIHCV